MINSNPFIKLIKQTLFFWNSLLQYINTFYYTNRIKKNDHNKKFHNRFHLKSKCKSLLLHKPINQIYPQIASISSNTQHTQYTIIYIKKKTKTRGVPRAFKTFYIKEKVMLYTTHGVCISDLLRKIKKKNLLYYTIFSRCAHTHLLERCSCFIVLARSRKVKLLLENNCIYILIVKATTFPKTI